MQPLINAARNPSSLLQRAPTSGQEQVNVLNQVRNMSRDQWVTVGVVAAEIVGFFSIGEMIGRWKIVGYRHTEEAHH
jgi:F-type H+-transporting ATPase subunit g